MNPINILSKFMIKPSVGYLAHRLLDLPVLAKWATLPSRVSVLEIGCKIGQTSRYLCDALRCKNYIAVDENPLMIAKAEASAKGDTKIIFQVADPLKLPFENETFDAVVSLDTLYTQADWKRAIREIWRVLKKNGKLMMKDYSIDTFTVPGVGFVLRNLFDYPYDYMFDQIELVTYLRKHGFVITHQNDNPWKMLLVALRNPHVRIH